MTQSHTQDSSCCPDLNLKRTPSIFNQLAARACALCASCFEWILVLVCVCVCAVWWSWWSKSVDPFIYAMRCALCAISGGNSINVSDGMGYTYGSPTTCASNRKCILNEKSLHVVSGWWNFVQSQQHNRSFRCVRQQMENCIPNTRISRYTKTYT